MNTLKVVYQLAWILAAGAAHTGEMFSLADEDHGIFRPFARYGIL